MSDPLPLEVDVQSVKCLLDRETSLWLVDCREPHEYEYCHIEGAELIPMRQIADQLGSPDRRRDRPLVVYCHHGIRSLKAVKWLREQGFAQAQSMSGGIDAWSLEIDEQVARY